MFCNFKMVDKVIFGRGSFNQAGEILDECRIDGKPLIFIIDSVFENSGLIKRIPALDQDKIIFTDISEHEPKTGQVDDITAMVKEFTDRPGSIIGVGGGSVMDISKAVSVMYTNPGQSADYQGWDLPKVPSIHHTAVPTLSGTGAEVSRTAVLTGPVRKLGINSDYSVFNQIILDPELLDGVPADQRFYTAMDCYIHCVESLEGTFLNAFSQAYGEKALDLCKEVFLEEGCPDADDKLMMASYSGGMSIAYSQVGVCHALSYGLSYVCGTRHGIGNSIVFDYLDEFYPEGVEIFREMLDIHKIELPRGLTKDLSEAQFEKMVEVAWSLEPLWENALGKDWKNKISKEKIRLMFEKM